MLRFANREAASCERSVAELGDLTVQHNAPKTYRDTRTAIFIDSPVQGAPVPAAVADPFSMATTQDMAVLMFKSDGEADTGHAPAWISEFTHTCADKAGRHFQHCCHCLSSIGFPPGAIDGPDDSGPSSSPSFFAH